MDNKSAESYSDVESHPDFAVIWSFFSKFGKQLEMEGVMITDVAKWISTHQSAAVVAVMVKLMRKIGMRVDKQRWQKHLIKAAAKQDLSLAADLQTGGFHALAYPKKLKLLKMLCEMQFDDNLKFKATINNEEADQQRFKPVGRDEEGLVYWHQEDEDLNVRVYIEDEDEDDDIGWKLVCKSKEEVGDLIKRLSNEPTDKEKNENSDEEDADLVETKFQKFLKTQCTSESNDDKHETLEFEEKESNETNDNEVFVKTEKGCDVTTENSEIKISNEMANKVCLEKTEFEEGQNTVEASGADILQTGLSETSQQTIEIKPIQNNDVAVCDKPQMGNIDSDVKPEIKSEPPDLQNVESADNMLSGSQDTIAPEMSNSSEKKCEEMNTESASSKISYDKSTSEKTGDDSVMESSEIGESTMALCDSSNAKENDENGIGRNELLSKPNSEEPEVNHDESELKVDGSESNTTQQTGSAIVSSSSQQCKSPTDICDIRQSNCKREEKSSTVESEKLKDDTEVVEDYSTNATKNQEDHPKSGEENKTSNIEIEGNTDSKEVVEDQCMDATSGHGDHPVSNEKPTAEKISASSKKGNKDNNEVEKDQCRGTTEHQVDNPANVEKTAVEETANTENEKSKDSSEAMEEPSKDRTKEEDSLESSKQIDCSKASSDDKASPIHDSKESPATNDSKTKCEQDTNPPQNGEDRTILPEISSSTEVSAIVSQIPKHSSSEIQTIVEKSEENLQEDSAVNNTDPEPKTGTFSSTEIVDSTVQNNTSVPDSISEEMQEQNSISTGEGVAVIGGKTVNGESAENAMQKMSSDEKMDCSEQNDETKVTLCNGDSEDKNLEGKDDDKKKNDSEELKEVEEEEKEKKHTPKKKRRRRRGRPAPKRKKTQSSAKTPSGDNSQRNPSRQKKPKASRLEQLKLEAESILHQGEKASEGSKDAYRTRSGRRVKNAKKEEEELWQTIGDEENLKSKQKESEDEEFQYVESKKGKPRTTVKETPVMKPSKRIVDDEPCMKCGLSSHPETILLCDSCDKGHHMACLTPPLMLIPDDDWFCPKCSKEN